ncbi:MAG TPA: hypothetical protein VI072_24040 [Polyangiaceae bacterium]
MRRGHGDETLTVEREATPSFAAAGSGYFGVWRDAGAGNAISGVALSASSSPLGAVISVAGANASDVRPLVASNGSMYVAFWNEEERLLARGFGAAGTPTTNTITVAERGNLESAVYDGRTFLVFHSVTDQSGRPAVVMQRLTPSLQLLSGAVTLDIRNVLAAASGGPGRTAIGYQRFDWTLGRRIITAPNAGPLPPLTCAGP